MEHECAKPALLIVVLMIVAPGQGGSLSLRIYR